jgi:CTP synthase (UTP-ammonia lyase)
MIRIALLGDFDSGVTAHRAIPRALALAGDAAGLAVTPQWVHTSALTEPAVLPDADGVWCVPASPYANPSGVLAAIRAVREGGIPFLGTCGGFQHALLEAAQSLWGIAAPQHAEDAPDAREPVIAPLACSLVEVSGAVRFAPGSRLASAYGALEAEEQYHCRYGLHPSFVARLAAGPLRATAWDQAGEVRAVELDGHPFFVATLFQPERRALAGGIPPLVDGFLRAVARGPVAPARSGR